MDDDECTVFTEVYENNHIDYVMQHGQQFHMANNFAAFFETLVAGADEYNKAKVGRAPLLDARRPGS